MRCFFSTFPTPFGLFSIAVDEPGAVIATAFGGPAELRRRARLADFIEDDHAAHRGKEQVLAYCAGERREFSLSLAPVGTAFQQAVWAALQRIPFGTTNTYGEIAAGLGRPGAARAVGRANATNPICLIVPCHRVIGAGGALTGFAFGEACKQQLLAHERAIVSHSRAA